MDSSNLPFWKDDLENSITVKPYYSRVLGWYAKYVVVVIQLITIAIPAVVYDDDRVPHIDVIDSAAQALQITFSWREQSCTCLFRRMRKVRPIDWYHAIQQKRLQLSS